MDSLFDVTDISELQIDTRREHQLALLAYPLMGGTAIDGVWLQMEKNNHQSYAGDEATYDTDWAIKADGDVIGYLDSEEKQQWLSGPWPWTHINIAKHPMQHWQRGAFNGRETNKLISFRQKPAMSFWVGVRPNYTAAMIVRAQTLFAHASEYLQPTRYSAVPLPILRLNQSFGHFCDTAHEFTHTIIKAFKETRRAND